MRVDAARIHQGVLGRVGGIDSGGGLAGGFHGGNGFGDGLRPLMWRHLGGGLAPAVDAAIFGRFGQRQRFRVGLGQARERDGLLHHVANGIGVQAIGGGACGASFDARRAPKMHALLGDVLMDGIVGEARQRAAIAARDQGLDIGDP